VVFTPGVEVAMVSVVEFPTTPAGIVSGVVVVVVVVTERVGAGGGSEETVCDSGSEAQPASRPMAPQIANTDGIRLITSTQAGRDSGVKSFVFMLRD
jgi:hypothetical protein